MEAAVFIALSIAVLVTIVPIVLLPLIMSGKRWKAAEKKARARRIADAKMNARLLRFNL